MKNSRQSDDAGQASRRRFTKTVAAAFAAAPLVSLMAKAQTPPGGGKTKEATAPPNPQPSPSPQPQKPSPVAEGYAAVARARFGEQVTAEQFEQIRKDLEGNVRVAERLRSVKLKNEDEPDFTFIA